MLIYLSMCVPVIAVLILYFKWNHKCLWYELLIPFVVSLVICTIMKLSVEGIQTSDTEWWTGSVVHAEYFEEWDEEVSCRHPKYKTVTKTRTVNGKTETYTETEQDGYEHFYDVDYHSPYWQVIDNNGVTIGINKNKFIELTHKFKNKQFVNLHRNYHSINGNKHVTTWDGSDDKCEICTSEHKYKNRVIASHSVFKFPEPDSKEGLFEYPSINSFYESKFILGSDDAVAERKLSLWNARNGRDKQCRLMFLLYNELPIDVALNQENYWQGGNKNEFIVTVGLNGGKVKWCYVISWTEQDVLKTEVKNFILSQDKFDLNKSIEVVGDKVKGGFVRKRFRDFDYLTVEPPFWTVVLTFFLTIGVNVGVSVWVIRR